MIKLWYEFGMLIWTEGVSMFWFWMTWVYFEGYRDRTLNLAQHGKRVGMWIKFFSSFFMLLNFAVEIYDYWFSWFHPRRRPGTNQTSERRRSFLGSNNWTSYYERRMTEQRRCKYGWWYDYPIQILTWPRFESRERMHFFLGYFSCCFLGGWQSRDDASMDEECIPFCFKFEDFFHFDLSIFFFSLFFHFLIS